VSHAANNYLNSMIFGLDYSNLLLADTSTRFKQKWRLPYRRKVSLKYFSDTCRAWLLTRSLAWETFVSWKRNVSRAFESYIPIERANLLGESHSRYPRPFPAHCGSFALPEGRKTPTPASGSSYQEEAESASIGNQWNVSRGFLHLIEIFEEGTAMFETLL
jgi:hypothetical protein